MIWVRPSLARSKGLSLSKLTVSMRSQLPPLSVLNHQEPLVWVMPDSAIPSGLPSASLTGTAPNRVPMLMPVVPGTGASGSSLMLMAAGPAPSKGAELPLWTVTPMLSVIVPKALCPPPGVMSTPVWPFALPSVRSQARRDKAVASGPGVMPWKYSRVVLFACSNRALVSLTAPMVCHVVPLLVVYHHVPVVTFTPVTAMPRRAPASGSVKLVPALINAPTAVPTAPFPTGEPLP